MEDNEESEDSTNVVESVTNSGSHAVYRKRLPSPMLKHKLSIWALLKQSIGKDLTRMTMPLEIFEPLGLLQIYCEELEYSELLDKAVQESNPYKRMGYIAAFAVSRYAATATRALGKPFNPVEGETYECIRGDMGWRFLGEQISHHPGISACHAIGNGWKWWQTASFEMAFWGNSIEAKPKSPVDISIRSHKEAYRWNKIATTVHSLIIGKRYLSHHGEMFVKSSSRVQCKLIFSKTSQEVKGSITDQNGKTMNTMTGKWSEYMNFDQEKIWSANKVIPHAQEQYGFGDFQVSLNEITPDIKEFLPPTDTRLRTDQKCLEEGKIAEGKIHKAKIEEDQRTRRKNRPKYTPKWFTEKAQPGQPVAANFNRRYWRSRAKHFEGEEFDKLW